jgi:hypothetical protein
MYVQGVQFIFNTLELHTPQHDSPAACFIVQLCSFVTFVSLRSRSLNEKIGALLKNVFFSVLKIAYV